MLQTFNLEKADKEVKIDQNLMATHIKGLRDQNFLSEPRFTKNRKDSNIDTIYNQPPYGSGSGSSDEE